MPSRRPGASDRRPSARARRRAPSPRRAPARRRSAAPDDFEWLLGPWDFAVGLPARLWGALGRAAAGARGALRAQPAARWFLLVLLAALAFRLWRPDWYAHNTFHPDERWLFEKTAALDWPGEPGRDDPAGLQYGSLPLYAVAAAKDLARVFHADAYSSVIVWGRTLTGCVDTLTVLGVFLLAWAVVPPGGALLAALVAACAPLSILFAHFFTVDPWLACFSTFTLLACVRLARGPSKPWSAAAGILYAAALASKSSGLPLALPIALAHALPVLDPGLPRGERSRRLRAAGLGLGLAAACALAAFFAFMPWALLDFHKFVANQTAQRDILVTGSPMGTPFVRQYWGTGAFFHLRNLCLFYLGLPAGALALLAVPGLAWEAAAKAWARLRPRPALRPSRGGAPAGERPFPAGAVAVLLAWVLPYFIIVDLSFAKFARYMLPLLPALAVLLALGLERLRLRFARAARLLAVACGVLAVGYGVGYFLTYFRPHPWNETSAWIYTHVPAVTADASAPGGRRPTRIVNEDWGDDLPLGLPGYADAYQDLKDQPGQVNVVEWDSAGKLAAFCRTLSQADVLILADPRAYGTYLRLPRRFPLTFTYYHLLFSDPGRLGFALAHESSNPLRLFGLWTLPDSRTPALPQWRWADESFTLYDRPHAFVFRRARAMGPDDVRQALLGALREQGLSERFLDGLSPDQLEDLASGRAPAPAFPPPAEPGAASLLPASGANRNFGLSRGPLAPLGEPVACWWLLVAVLGWLALPLSVRLFRGFPAGGYALSRALGVFLFGWLSYNLAWLFPKAWPFWQGRLWLLLAALAALAAWGVRRRARAVRSWLKANRAEVLFTEAVFAAAFLGFVLLRAYNPNIHDVQGQGYFGGGEPLGMTYLSAITRCATFPAYDPWLALANSSYYCYGYVLMAALTKLSGFPPAVTYNLSLALCFSLTLLGAFGLLRALTPRRWLALGGAAMVGLSGSLWTVAYLALQASRGALSWLGAWFSHGFIWDPTRFPDLVQGQIFEFPFFSYLYGDLHPHNIVLGFSVLLAALLLKPFLQAKPGWRAFGAGRGEALLWLGATALLLDAQYAINTWSWPVFVALASACLLIGPWAGKGLDLRGRLRASAWGLLFLAAALALGRVLMAGFRLYFLQDARSWDWVHPSEWQMSAYIPLAYYLPGLLALAALGGLRLAAWIRETDAALGKTGRARGLDRFLVLAPRYADRRPWGALGLGLGAGLCAFLLLWATARWQSQGVWALAAGLGLACLTLFALGGARRGGEAFVWVLGCAFCFMVVGTEFVYVADRTNTIFKVWMNGWVFMGLAFGGAFALAFERAPKASPAPRGRSRRRGGWDWVRRAPWLAALGVVALAFLAALADAHLLDRGGRFFVSYLAFGGLLLAVLIGGSLWAGEAGWLGLLRGLFYGLLALGLLYPVGAAGRRVWEASQFRDPHLDGIRFMAERDARPGFGANDYDRHDYALITWLNRNADVTETVAEAPGLELYQGFDRFSIYTGLPTLLGWDYQVGQQLGARTGGVLDERKHAAAVIYGADPAAAAAELRRYRVRWIVVGTLERRLYPQAGLEKFKTMATLAAQDGPSQLYRYDWDKP